MIISTYNWRTGHSEHFEGDEKTALDIAQKKFQDGFNVMILRDKSHGTKKEPETLIGYTVCFTTGRFNQS
ncbi:MAG: hypothetical protein KGL39_24655 [Patescibacteria group bacterium]|nr:hypothetical protein [Patescibacteria group bacterium]